MALHKSQMLTMNSSELLSHIKGEVASLEQHLSGPVDTEEVTIFCFHIIDLCSELRFTVIDEIDTDVLEAAE